MATPRSTSPCLDAGRAAVLAFAMALGGGCFESNASDDAGACSKTLPSDCSTIPSYASDIAPLIASHCVPCHSAGGVASDRDLTTYANVENLESTVLSQVYGCIMPPADAGPDAMLTPQERTDLLQWLVCNSPNN